MVRENMKSPWKVQSNLIGDEKMYIAYRVKDISQVVHSGNIEHFGEYQKDRAVVEALVEKLNKEEGVENKC